MQGPPRRGFAEGLVPRVADRQETKRAPAVPAPVVRTKRALRFYEQVAVLTMHVTVGLLKGLFWL